MNPQHTRGLRNALVLGLSILPALSWASERGAGREFERIKDDPVALRQFLYGFPKGGDLHNHLDGGIYAESFINWAAEDGKCIDLDSFAIKRPPCDASASVPPRRGCSIQCRHRKQDYRCVVGA